MSVIANSDSNCCGLIRSMVCELAYEAAYEAAYEPTYELA